MKLLIVGEWKWYHYERAFSESLEHSNIKVVKFSTLEYYQTILGKLEYRFPIFLFYSIILNIKLFHFIKNNKIKEVLFWRPTHIFPILLKLLKKENVKLFSYNNDDPFNNYKSNFKTTIYHKFLWFWYKKCVQYFDINFFYRSINIKESVKFKSLNSKLLLPYFIPWQIQNNFITSKNKTYDVIFIGHYEDDGRLEIINYLLDNDIDIRVWGSKKWDVLLKNKNYKGNKYFQEIHGIDYYKLLSNSKICISFLSKLNRDEYTRRSFEIPASSSLMLSERTKALENMFIENKEIIFFDDRKDLLQKINYLLTNLHIVDEISCNSYLKIHQLGGDINSRTQNFINEIYKFSNEK